MRCQLYLFILIACYVVLCIILHVEIMEHDWINDENAIMKCLK